MESPDILLIDLVCSRAYSVSEKVRSALRAYENVPPLQA